MRGRDDQGEWVHVCKECREVPSESGACNWTVPVITAQYRLLHGRMMSRAENSDMFCFCLDKEDGSRTL